MADLSHAPARTSRSLDKATLFQAYVDLINSERETIWARHNALLVANSLIVGALALSPTALERAVGPDSP